MSKLKVGIVGAGIGGLALAAALRRSGQEVHVYEQARQFARVGAGIQMGANAMKALRGIGVNIEAEVRRIGFRPASLLNRDYNTGAVTNELPGGDALEARYGAPHMCLHRADLHSMLLENVPESDITLGAKLESYEQDANGVDLVFVDGKKEHVDVLIGADGVHSVVRETMLGPDQPQFTGRVAYRTTFPASLLKQPLNESRTKWWGNDRHIVIYYITAERDEVYFVTSQPEDPKWMTPESWSSQGDVNELRAAFADFHPEVRDVLEVCPNVHKWALLARQPLPKWVERNVAIMGDGCHPMTPYMAQGAAMALEDAVILSRCLDEVTNVDGIGRALQRYETNRKQRASDVQALSAENTFLRRPGGTDWVYGYDVTQADLDVPGTTRPAD